MVKNNYYELAQQHKLMAQHLRNASYFYHKQGDFQKFTSLGYEASRHANISEKFNHRSKHQYSTWKIKSLIDVEINF